MSANIIAYIDMCKREGASLQKGMNFRLKGKHSVLLMSVQANAPYKDRVEEDGSVLIYEGHDESRTKNCPNPKILDQPKYRSSGNLTENGKFYNAAKEFVAGKKGADIVRVYEKIKPGIWSDNGFFHLVDSWVESDGARNVFKFKFIAVADITDETLSVDFLSRPPERSRIIPSEVKLAVWARDGGKCVTCGAIDELHFDHILPYSKGGTSLKVENIQLLCARHNLAKSAKIQ